MVEILRGSAFIQKNLPQGQAFLLMAEQEGFEPSIPYKRYTPLAGARFQPLSHCSKLNVFLLWRKSRNLVSIVVVCQLNFLIFTKSYRV